MQEKDERRDAMYYKYLALAKKAEEEGDEEKAERFRTAARRCKTT